MQILPYWKTFKKQAKTAEKHEGKSSSFKTFTVF